MAKSWKQMTKEEKAVERQRKKALRKQKAAAEVVSDEELFRPELTSKGTVTPADQPSYLDLIGGMEEMAATGEDSIISAADVEKGIPVKVVRVAPSEPVGFDVLVEILKGSYQAATGKPFVLPRCKERAEEMLAEVKKAEEVKATAEKTLTPGEVDTLLGRIPFEAEVEGASSGTPMTPEDPSAAMGDRLATLLGEKDSFSFGDGPLQRIFRETYERVTGRTFVVPTSQAEMDSRNLEIQEAAQRKLDEEIEALVRAAEIIPEEVSVQAVPVTSPVETDTQRRVREARERLDRLAQSVDEPARIVRSAPAPGEANPVVDNAAATPTGTSQPEAPQAAPAGGGNSQRQRTSDDEYRDLRQRRRGNVPQRSAALVRNPWRWTSPALPRFLSNKKVWMGVGVGLLILILLIVFWPSSKTPRTSEDPEQVAKKQAAAQQDQPARGNGEGISSAGRTGGLNAPLEFSAQSTQPLKVGKAKLVKGEVILDVPAGVFYTLTLKEGLPSGNWEMSAEVRRNKKTFQTVTLDSEKRVVMDLKRGDKLILNPSPIGVGVSVDHQLSGGKLMPTPNGE